MILADFVPLKTRNSEAPVLHEPWILEEAIGLQRRLGAIDMLRVEAMSAEMEALTGMKKRVQGKLLDKRAGILLKTGTLPDELMTDDDALTKAARTPQIDLENVRAIADKLAFVVMPFEYLDRRSYEAERPAMVSAIEGFVKELGAWFDIYVLAPAHYYDAHRHVEAKDDMSVYAGLPVSQAFMAITMTIPMFRAILGDMETIRKGMSKIDQRVARAEGELKNLARRLDEMRVQAERQQAEALLAQQRQESQMRRELEELRTRATFMAYEPMMLAVPKGTGINDRGSAIVGPCWGPDFEDIVIAALGFEKIPGQRDDLAQLAGRWASLGYRHNQRSW